MQLSVSNLAWPVEETDWCLAQLQAHGIEAIEAAPSKLFSSWQAVEQDRITDVIRHLERYHLHVSSFQSITFGVQEIALVGDAHKQKKLLDHFTTVAALLNALGGDMAVFGSPALRQERNLDTTQLVSFFSRANEIFCHHNVKLALETVPEYYGCQVLNTLPETDRFLTDAALSNVVRHFDTGCQFLSGDLENIPRCQAFLEKCEHLHISQQDLNDFSHPSSYNMSSADWIKAHYKGRWCVLELGDKQFSRERFVKSLENFIGLFADA